MNKYLDYTGLTILVDKIKEKQGALTFNTAPSSNNKVATMADVYTRDETDAKFVEENANGHDYIEIGGIKWATMNVGANSITDIGLYFQWGDIQGYTANQVNSGQKAFTENDYKYTNDGFTMTKYNSTDKKVVLDLSDDAVQANWSGSWRMPTIAEFQALSNAVNTVWTSNYNDSGVAGVVMTDKTDSSKVLFFPTTGYYYHGNIEYANDCYYWSSSINNRTVAEADIAYFSSDNINWNYNHERIDGTVVRGILDTTEKYATKSELSIVATSGNYNDLSNKPTIPNAQIQSDWNQTDSTAKDFIKNKPTIPVVPTNVSDFNNDAGYLTQHQDISGKADKSEMSVTNGTGANSDKTTIQLKSGTSATVLKSHQSLAGKQDTLISGTNIKTINNESILGNGNITIQDSRVQSDWNQSNSTADDFIKNKPTIPDTTNFVQKSQTTGLLKNDGTIDTNTYLTSAPVTSVNGSTGAVVISNATTSAAGLMSATDKQKVDSILSLITVSGTTATQALNPNVVYSFGTMTSLTITLGTPVSGINNQYIFEFDSGSTATNLSVPNDVEWPSTLSVKANTHYEMNIKYDASTQKYYGLVQEWTIISEVISVIGG